MMYGFQSEDSLKTLNGAVAQIGEINRIADKVSDLGCKSIYLVGMGGTYTIISPLAHMLKTNSTLVWYYEIAAELLAAKPRSLTRNSLFTMASLSGTTKETIATAEYARSMGATAISFVRDRTTPLAAVSDYMVENVACNDDLVEELHIQFFALGARLMLRNGEFLQYERFVETLRKTPEVLLRVREQNDERALAFAEKRKDTGFHMCVGAGNTWGEIYCSAMYVLEEMLQISTKSIHAAEFFHGTAEMTDKNMSFMFFKGEDETHPLVDRVENLVKKYSDVVQAQDTRDYPLEGIDADMRKYVPPTVMSTQLERVSVHFEHVKDRNLGTYRYYRTMKYQGIKREIAP